MRALNPTIKILSLILLAISVYQLSAQALCALLIILVLVVLFYSAKDFIKLIKRAKWLLIAMLLIYALTTPGEYIQSWPLEFAPTYEGLHQGLMQVIRMLAMLAGLALLNKLTTREELIAGFYILLMPLKWVKLAPERFASRLWLTLHYVESAAKEKGASAQLSLSERLAQLDAEPTTVTLETINLSLAKFTWRDGLAIFVIMILVYLLCVLP